MSSDTSNDKQADLDATTENEAQEKPIYMGPPKREEVVDQNWEPDCALFMDSIDDDSEEIKALQSLQFDDNYDPKEVAENYKEQGNEFFKSGPKFYRNAIKCYSSALLEKTDDAKANSIYLSNRAAVQLKLHKENYRSVVEDCQQAVRLDNNNIKAYFRAGSACFHVRKWEDALNWCNSGLELAPKNKQLLVLQKKAKSRFDAAKAKEEKERKQKELELKKKKEMEQALQKRGIVMGELLFDTMRQYEGHPHFLVEPSNNNNNNNNSNNKQPTDGILAWPILFLYPEYQQSDFMQSVNENDNLLIHIATLFPGDYYCPWDTKQEYYYKNVVVLYQTNASLIQQTKSNKYAKQKWIQVDVNKTIKQILSEKDHVIPGIPVFHVLIKDSQFHHDFIKET